MATQVYKNCKLYVGHYDLSGDVNALGVKVGAEMLDDTTFGRDTRSRVGGLRTVSMEHSGFWRGGATAADQALFSRVGLADVPSTVCPTTGAEGEVCYHTLLCHGQYSPQGQVGEIFKFDLSAEARKAPLVRGVVAASRTIAASTSGTGYQLGSIGSTQRLYAALHVLAVSGTSPSLTVAVESDGDNTFASPTSRLTFSASTGVGSQWAPIVGPVTDGWWRFSATVSGTTPSFTFVLALGIL